MQNHCIVVALRYQNVGVKDPVILENVGYAHRKFQFLGQIKIWIQEIDLEVVTHARRYSVKQLGGNTPSRSGSGRSVRFQVAPDDAGIKQ